MSTAPRVLVIDDNPDDRLLAIRALRHAFADISVHEITDLQMFAAALEADDFDAVITDFSLNWSNGLDILREVKARDPDRPVVMFTRTGDEEVAVEAMKAGLDDYVVKSPHHFVRLPAALRASLQRSHERRRAAEAEERFHLMVENARDFAFILLDPHGRITEWLGDAERVFGYTAGEITGRQASILRTPEDRESGAQEKELEQATGAGRAEDDNWAEHKDGHRLWVSGVTIALRNGGLRGFAKIVRDETDHKRFEEALKTRARQQEVVAELGRRALVQRDLNLLMDEVVETVAATLNVEYCKVLELLPGGEELRLVAGIGWREGLVGQATVGSNNDSQAGYTLMVDQPVIVKDLRIEQRFSGPPLLHEHQVVSGVSGVIGGQTGPYGVLGAHTREHREFSRDDANFLQSVANVLATAIRRKTFEERIVDERAETARLEALDSVRAEFISSISHDLKTPLTAIRSGIGLVEMSAAERLEHDELELLESARGNTRRLGSMIDQLLTYNELQAGTLDIEREPLDLRDVVLDAIDVVHPLIREKGQTLELDLPEALSLCGDATRLSHALINILGNAHKHTSAGTRIAITGTMQSQVVVLTVSDTGPGIPDDALEVIFERWRTLQPASGGSGLGLTIAKGIVELHGGRLWAESSPGDGARFDIELPVAAREDRKPR